MAIFSSNRSIHIENIDLTKSKSRHNNVLFLDNKYSSYIYICIVSRNALPLKLNVKINDYIYVGTLIGSFFIDEHEVLVRSSVSGKIINQEEIYDSRFQKKVPHLVVQNDHKYHSLKVCKEFSKDSTRAEIINSMKLLALTGLSGNNFPIYIKYLQNNIDYLLINCIECEPYLTTDEKAIYLFSKTLIEGIDIALKASSAKKCFICIKKNKKYLINILKKEIENHDNITLKLFKDEYPIGWEKLLIYKTLKKDYNTLPFEVHCIVNNVQTIIELAKGSKTGTSMSFRQITFNGNNIHHNLIVPIGIKIKDVLSYFNISLKENEILILNGPMCGYISTVDSIINSFNDGLLILKNEEINSINCIRCGKCTSYCPSYLQPVEIKNAFLLNDYSSLKLLNPSLCIQCHLCSYLCPSKIDISFYVLKAKKLLKIR